jgi:hypothetical protein
LAKTGSPVTISAGDEGGPLTNGVTHTGRIGVGDLDVWTVAAAAGERINVRMGDLGGTNSLDPWLRLIGPDGQLLKQSFSTLAAEVDFRVTNSGVFLVLAGAPTF